MKVAELLTEIDHDDSVYGKMASNYVMNFKIDDSWKSLLSIDGNKVVWKQTAQEYRVVMVDQAMSQPIMRLELLAKTVKVPGGTLTGVVTSLLSSKMEFRGKGHALKIYEALLDHGQVLFSSNSQTSGSRKLWETLVQQRKSNAFVLAQESAARWYIKKYDDEIRSANVLLTGSYNRMNDEAYASEETRWVIVPGNVDALRKAAINLDGAKDST
jgi:hypothetical protein